MAHADVTSMVQTAGSSDYYVADIALATGSAYMGRYGGWAMLVVYNDPTEKTRCISVWDGFDFFGFGANDNFRVTGLLTPGSGIFETYAGYFGMDGEACYTGDYVSINGTALANGLNASNNTLNGTISEFGVDVGGKSPNLGYNWEMDIDVFDGAEHNYIDIGAWIGDQSAALAFMGMGNLLGLWELTTPLSMGLPADMCNTLAQNGMISIKANRRLEII